MEALIEVIYCATTVRLTFSDVEMGRATYEQISTALKEYQRFKNDRAETIEVSTGEGKATLKLERMDSVLFNEPQAFDEGKWRAAMTDEKRVRDLREELGLPPLPTKR